MCSNPASISSSSSFSSCATLHVKCSLVCRKSVFSMVTYICVFVMLLCPSTYFTCMMSLVSWYSVVPFQCLIVWNPMLRSLGLLNRSANVLRSLAKWVLNISLSGWNIVVYLALGSRGKLRIVLTSLSLIGKSRALLCFSGVMFMVFLCVSMSIGLSCVISPIRAPVSFMHKSKAWKCFPALLMSISISSSVGMNGILSGFL